MTLSNNCVQFEALLGCFEKLDIRARAGHLLGRPVNGVPRESVKWLAVLSFNRSDNFLAQPALVLQEGYAQGKKVYVKVVDGLVWLWKVEISPGAFEVVASEAGHFRVYYGTTLAVGSMFRSLLTTRYSLGSKLADHEFRHETVTLAEYLDLPRSALQPPVEVTIHIDPLADVVRSGKSQWSYTSSEPPFSDMNPIMKLNGRTGNKHLLPVRYGSEHEKHIDWIYFYKTDNPTRGFAVL